MIIIGNVKSLQKIACKFLKNQSLCQKQIM